MLGDERPTCVEVSNQDVRSVRLRRYVGMPMNEFETVLVPGHKPPYASWTFIEVPPAIAKAIGHGPVRVTVSGTSFRGTASRSQGVLRVPVKREVLERAGVACGDRVAVTLARDAQPRPVHVPPELQKHLDGNAALRKAFDALPPSHRRAWASYVAEAKQAATRERRAAKAPDGIRSRSFPR